MLKQIKKEQGITLIALVITIIVLLILAGVSINLVLGNNGVLTQAQNAVIATNSATAEEEVKMAVASAEADYWSAWAKGEDATKGKNKEEYVAEQAVTKYLSGKGANFEGNQITYQGRTFTVAEDGGVSAGDSINDTETNNKTLLSKVKSNRAGYYGKKVSGYTANGVSDWRIFYADKDNVFIIATDYLEAEKAVACNSTMTASGKYRAYWNTVPTTASTTNHVDKFSPVTAETMAWGGDYGANSNGKCVSTLLDTSKWSAFVDSSKASLAIGSPTLNMWVASWNAKYPSNKLYCNKSNTTGYFVGINKNGDSCYEIGDGAYWITDKTMSTQTGYQVSETENMYYPHKSVVENCYGYWLASPSASRTDCLMRVYFNGAVGDYYYDSDFYAVRPVVGLNSDIETDSTEADSVIVIK